MGSFFTDVLSFKHETAVFDVNPQKLRFMYNCYRFTQLDEIKDFKPELVINAATVKYTLDAFNQVLPVLPKDCIISDIASGKPIYKTTKYVPDKCTKKTSKAVKLFKKNWNKYKLTPKIKKNKKGKYTDTIDKTTYQCIANYKQLKNAKKKK